MTDISAISAIAQPGSARQQVYADRLGLGCGRCGVERGSVFDVCGASAIDGKEVNAAP